MAKRPSDRLIERLRAENGLEVPEGTYVARTHAGRRMRAAGAWIFRLHAPDGSALRPMTGSHWRVSDLLRFRRLTVTTDRFGDRCIDPDATGAEIRKIFSPDTTQQTSRVRE